MTTTITKSVRGLIREVYESTEYDNSAEIADEVFARTDQADIQDYYKEMLRGAVTAFLSNERSRVRHEAKPSLQERIASGELTPRPKKTKADQVRDWWSDFKRQIIVTESGTKLAGKCTADDWMFAATQLRHNAKSMEELADRYERLSNLVGDGTTADVDPDEVRKLF